MHGGISAIRFRRIIQRLQFLSCCQQRTWDASFASHGARSEVFEEIRTAGDLLPADFHDFIRRIRVNSNVGVFIPRRGWHYAIATGEDPRSSK